MVKEIKEDSRLNIDFISGFNLIEDEKCEI